MINFRKAQIAEKRDKISMQQQMLNAATEARKDFIKKKEDEMAKKLAVKQQEGKFVFLH